MDEQNYKRLKRSYSTEVLLEYSDSDNDITEIINNISKLNIDNELFKKIIKKIDNLEKKVESLSLVNIKIDTLKKDIDKIMIEKDYIIDNLKIEVTELKNQLKENNNHIISSNNINNYYT